MTEVIPEVLVGDRMRIALRHADMTAGQMAEYLDVGRNTVSTWMNGHIKPKRQTMILWAMRTGVPLEWLETGVVRHQGLEPRTRWLMTVQAGSPDSGDNQTADDRYPEAA